MEVDEHEPQYILQLLDQTLDLDVGPWNSQGWADYHYTGVKCFCHGSDVYNLERKTWGDLAGGIEEVEEQLSNQLQIHPGVHHRLLIEGVAEPAQTGILLYTKNQGQNSFRSGLRGNKKQAYKSITAWLLQVGKYWEILWSPTMAASAVVISSCYNADQVEEDQHSTFKRIFKSYDYKMNPQAVRILGASADVKFGPVRAEAAAQYFGTSWRAFKAPLEEWVKVPGIGETTARAYLRGIGRADV